MCCSKWSLRSSIVAPGIGPTPPVTTRVGMPSVCESTAAPASIHPGWLDRSPCGTGTSARLAQLHARGELAVGDPFVNASVIGTRFTGRIVEETEVAGIPAIVPEITGRAWITGMGQYLLDADDPFPAGFRL